MVLRVDINDEKSELFLALLKELKDNVIKKYEIIEDNFFDKKELLNRIEDLENNRVKPLSKEEVFNDLLWRISP